MRYSRFSSDGILTSKTWSARSPARENWNGCDAGDACQPAGTLERQGAFGFRFSIVEELHLYFDRLRQGAEERDRVRGGHRQPDRGDDRQHPRVVAVRQVGIEACHRTSHLDRHSVHVIPDGGFERRLGEAWYLRAWSGTVYRAS